MEVASISYLVKRFVRSWKLFLALLLSVALASTFFSGVNIGADTVAKEVLDRQLKQIPVDIQITTYSSFSADNLTDLADKIGLIEGITHIEIISRFSEAVELPGSNETNRREAYFRIVGIQNDSYIYDGLRVTNGSSVLGANETYVWAGSTNAKDLKLGDILQINITLWYYVTEPNSEGQYVPQQYTTQNLAVNLTVAGFVDLDEQALVMAEGYYYVPDYQIRDNLLIVDWNRTAAGIVDAFCEKDSYVDLEIDTFVDRDSLISIWDIDGSIERIRTITYQIRYEVDNSSGHANVNNRLESILSSNKSYSQLLQLTFIVTSLPVFFIAWYLGSTASDVSYNLRRREIGLLLTKGFSRRQMLRMFLSESVLIGLIGGLIGLGLSFIATPFFMYGGSLTVTPTVGRDTVIATLVFSAALTLLAVFQPARRASKLDILDALQEYRYVEEVKPYRKRWPWVALILGSYKIGMWLLGVNTYNLIMGLVRYTGVLFGILIGVWLVIDTALGYVGPVLFFWGITKILIRGSLKFQELIARLVKFAGDLSVLSTKNVRRNPARTAAIAFLIAMIIGYGFQTIGTYASEQDYVVRYIRFSVGSDISAQMSIMQNLSSIMDAISTVSGVSAVTSERTFYGHSGGGYYMTFIAVDPEKWLSVANLEDGLFTGRDIVSAFQEMKNNNNTIILERGIATAMGLSLDSTIAVSLDNVGQKIFNFTVVGFFGPDSSQTVRYGGIYWSYVPEGFYQSVKNEVGLTNGKILVKLSPGADGEQVAEDIRDLELNDVSYVYSVAELLKQRQENPLAAVLPGNPLFGITGSTEIQRLGVAFAVLAASFGAALVTFVSLSERRREIGMMSVRGLSFRQIVGVMLVENLAVIGFAVFLGAVVGLIVVQGNVSAQNSVSVYMPGPLLGTMTAYSYSPILHRMVFPLDSILALAVCCCLVFVSTVVPVVLTVKRYISDLERIVR